MKIPLWLRYFKGKKFIVYMDGTVKKDKVEMGYLNERSMNEVERLELFGVNLDFFIKDNLIIPATLQDSVNKIFQEQEKQKKYNKHMKAFKIDILKDFMKENELEELIQKYKKAILTRKGGGRKDVVSEMYKDYITNKMSFEEIASKYNYKQIGKIENMISKYALQLQKGKGSPTAQKRKQTRMNQELLSKSDIETYLNRIENETMRDVVKRKNLENETLLSIAENLGLSYGYLAKMNRDGLAIIINLVK